MYTPEQRERLREVLTTTALADERLGGVALSGSAAVERQDAWSDVDLVLAVADGGSLATVIDRWTDSLYRVHGAVHHVDLPAGGGVYRAFLLPTTLQVDLTFAPASEFAPRGPKFRLLSGVAGDPPPAPAMPAAGELVGMGWLFAVQARSCIARDKPWQATRMLGETRDRALSLACLRHGLPAVQGIAFDRLPPETLAPFADCLVRSLDGAELRRAFAVVLERLLAETREADAVLAQRLESPLRGLAASLDG